VLYIAAHPDDEDTRLITWLSQGGHAEVAYLSLSRGEGGQNVIGDELGDALGVLRTQELLAARRVDGAYQFFTRAYDFGYSKSAAETFMHWPHDSLLNDVTRIVRAFRPHVIVATFSGSDRDAHGQHQVSGLLARDAYMVADDTVRFPRAQFGEPWQPLKLYRSAAFSVGAPTIAVNVGEYNPLSGRSYMEIAGDSRSRHMSQGFRADVRLGTALREFRREATRVNADTPAERESSILDGVPGARRTGEGRDPAIPLDVGRPESALPTIALFGPRGEWERNRYDRAAALMSGIAFEAVAARPFVAAGDTATVTYTLYNRGTVPVRVDSGAGSVPREWISPGSAASWTAVWRPLRITQPWWLERPRSGDLYDAAVTGVTENERGQQHWASAMVAISGLSLPARMGAPVIHRRSEPPYGDVLTPILVAPGLTVTPARAREYVRARAPLDRELNVLVQSHFPGEHEVTVRSSVSSGLSLEPREQRLTIQGGATRTIGFRVHGTPEPGEHVFVLEAEADGQRFPLSVQVVDYPHIAPQRLYRRAEIRITAVDANIPPGLRVAYVVGMADEGAQVLDDLGVPVQRITVDQIPRLDLARFSTIVIGPRVYETTELQQHNQRLFDFVRAGGRMVVQFGQYPMAGPGILPYPITTRPATRVTDENAAVSFTQPDAPELNYPNRITPADFTGWVQEIATFMPATFDPRYRTMLAMNDPGEDIKHSAVLVTTMGEGTYVYVTLALFRQFLAGVPGAARIFLNLVAPPPPPR
jgi:LmbE family N-acetylglucosaminyl deacetylase